MTDWLSKQQRSLNMSSIRSVGNKTTEQRVASLLRRSGLTGWRRHLKLPGKPDFTFRRERVAVFVDGCFWHGCPSCYRLPGDNRPYWREKLASNRRRDRRANRELRIEGWAVLRVWEHLLESNAGQERCVTKLKSLLGRD